MNEAMPWPLVTALTRIGIPTDNVTEWQWNDECGGYDIRLAPYAQAVTMKLNIVPIGEAD